MVLPLTVVVPTYRPTAAVVDLVRVLVGVAENVLVSDDGSPCTFDPILREIEAITSVQLHGSNVGIARALNEGLLVAKEHGHEWLLTVDQDTDIDPSYVSSLYEYALEASECAESVGVVAPRLIQVGGTSVGYPEKRDRSTGLLTTHEVFQSGALWNVNALRLTSGFDEELGMDAVDAAACLRLRERGFSIVLAPDLVLDHGWGDAEFIAIGRRSVAVTHHSPERRRTMVRNRLRLAPAEFRQSPVHGLRTMRRLVVGTALALALEKGRREKFQATVAGFRQATKR